MYYVCRKSTMYVEKGLPNFYLASDKSFLEGDGVFVKAINVLDHLAKSTPLPRLRIIDRPLVKKLGYKDEVGIERGIKSSIIGLSLKDNPDKARGIRGPVIYYEEDGLFPDLEKAWNVNRKAVEDGDITFGIMIAGGTGGTVGASFEGSEKLFYSPGAYNVYGIENVFDKNTNGGSTCGFFWGAYLNRALCYDIESGEPDVIKALLETLKARDHIRKNQQDPNALTQAKAEDPVVPAEAVMRVDGTIFPVSDLKDVRDNIRIQGQPFFNSHYIGDLISTPKGVEWKPSLDKMPIRKYPMGTDKPEGAIEIFEMPKTNAKGKIDNSRYIGGIDPVDDDHSGTNSLTSIVIFDLFTDRIVAEYTGRPKFANDFYEICRKMLMFYNAKANYENDKKGLFTYFDQKRCIHLLCETPQILRDMDYVKGTGYGNKAVGTPSGKIRNAWGRRLQRDWMLSSAMVQEYDENNEQIGDKLNMHTIRSVAYLEELIAWNIDINTDRVSAMGMLMIYREDRLKYLANASGEDDNDDFDEYIEENYKNAFSTEQKSHELNQFMNSDIL